MEKYQEVNVNKANDDNLVVVQHLRKYYGEGYNVVRAVDDISFSIKRGEIYGLLGPNGAGKSTTIKTLLGLLSITDGQVSVFGLSPLKDSKIIKANIGYVPEEPNLYSSMTVREVFDFVASIRKMDPGKATYITQSLLQSLDAVKYYNSVIGSLSRGNKQKVQLILALMHEPRLLILDEPLSGLDVRSGFIVKNIFQAHLSRGGSIILSTHIMEQAQQLCTRIGIINQGKLIVEGTFNELQSKATQFGGASLEEIFLRLTDNDPSAQYLIRSLQNSQNEDSS